MRIWEVPTPPLEGEGEEGDTVGVDGEVHLAVGLGVAGDLGVCVQHSDRDDGVMVWRMEGMVQSGICVCMESYSARLARRISPMSASISFLICPLMKGPR